MLTEFLKELKSQTTSALAPVEVKANLGPRQKAFVINGTIVRIEVPDPPLNYTVETPEDFVTLANRFGVSLVLVGQEKITGYCSYEKRLDKVVWERRFSPLFALLHSWLEGVVCTQQKLIELLRVDLCEAEGATTMLQSVRNLRFLSGTESTSNLQRGDESLGREVRAKMTGAGQIAESLTIQTYLYQDQVAAGVEPNAVEILVDILPHEERLRLRTKEQVLLDLIQATRIGLRDFLDTTLLEAEVVLGEDV